MKDNMQLQRVLITGAAGNLGNLLAQHLKDNETVELNLLTHKKEVRENLKSLPNVHLFKADLADKETLTEALEGVDTVVHFAGVLFKAHPEKFLPVTNTLYFSNLLQIAIKQKVKKIILISFPHVEGDTNPDNPARGSLDKKPISYHANTRLEEEILLFDRCRKNGIQAVSLRVGMVYGSGILMIDAAQWFAKHYLLGVWRKPTFIHLISKEDFVLSVESAIKKPGAQGIYHIGDDGIQTLQEFLDEITTYRGNKKPWRMPVWMIMTAATFFEWISLLWNVPSPLTRDFIKIGMVSYYGDTSRMKEELLPVLKYPTFRHGMETF
ncbi:MAG: NAD(P)-dependent oxidoreductase [Bacteroidales bacterium]|nr:NAD(P)-dependent oxidoreductase [Bacteroidales bacterium]